VLGVVLCILLVGGTMALLAPSVLRHRGDLPGERAMAEIVKGAAVPSDAKSLRPPGPLTERTTLNGGRQAYTGSCASCHGATGDGKGAFGAALYPNATDLRSADTQGKTDGELFWIIKNGLSFGGMPAFGEMYPDQTIWAMVGYLRAMVQNPQANQPLRIPTPSPEDIARADPHASDPTARGAAVFMAKGCVGCHGPRGNAPGDLTIGPDRDAMASIDTFKGMLNKPDAPMPIFYPNRITDQEAEDVYAYVRTFNPRPGRR
jgi:mono/diheme cytochrome c family protein